MFENLNWGSTSQLDVDKLNKMVANDNYLYQTMISGYYDTLGIVRDSGLSLRAGHIKAVHTEEMGVFISSTYSRPFLPGTRPVVVTGLVCENYFNIIHAVKNLDGTAIPDHRGFYVMLWQLRDPGSPTKFQGEQYISYLSVGPNG